MPTTPLLPLPDGLDITSVSETEGVLLVRVTSNRPSCPCPVCTTPSEHIHSYTVGNLLICLVSVALCAYC